MASSSASGSRSSVVWTLMERSFDRKKATCKVCRATFSHQGSTTTILKHLQRAHPTELEQARTEKDQEHRESSSAPATSSRLTQMSVLQSLEKSKPYDPHGQKKRALDTLLMEMIAADLQPFSIVEDRGFLRFVKGLDPKYSLPSRRTLTRSLLPQLYIDEQAKVMHLLMDTNFVCLTTDHWSSRRIQGFLTVTAHFVTSDWELQACVLDTVRIATSLTAQTIAGALTEVMDRWKITDKVFAVITDNAANMKLAVDLLGVRHGPCFAPLLNLVVSDALKSPQAGIEEVKKKVKIIVAHFKHSVKASDNLERLQRSAPGAAGPSSSSEPLRLIQEVDTRWNSTFYMFQRFLHLYQFVKAALLEEDKPEKFLTEEELNKVKEAITVLEPFELTTREMSSEKYPTASKIIPLVDNLEKIMRQTKGDLAAQLRSGILSRFAGAEERFLWAAATFIDSRFKKHGFRNPDNAQVLLKLNLFTDAYKGIGVAYKLQLTLHVSQGACERSFSALKGIKTYHRSTMTPDYLEAFMLVSVEKEILTKLDNEDIIDAVAAGFYSLRNAPG
ncbi:zinc finger BED domain-containing protein 4 [Aplysia californica]|uniref:Zinc finger BED domain-containing protein 4 n=1 Tax=Aplysia californica TaxID=6500 RepID=A0ABM0JVI8_APLCA|nr:zinc finger BED domain-containing protein 4 [Aplysia californica]